MNDLLGGHVDASFATLSSILPQVRSGNLRALLMTSRDPRIAIARVPSAGELGFDNLIVVNWNVFSPRREPARDAGRLHAAIVEAGNDPAVIDATRKAGAEPMTSTPSAASARLAEDLARWTRIAKDNGIKIE